MRDPSFFISIDESGDQGFRFGCENPSTEWFVLSAVVSLNQHESGLTQSVKELKRQVGWNERKPLHFKRLKTEEQRRGVVCRLAQCHRLIRATSVLVYKPMLTNPETFREGNRLYFYFTRYLLERASWICAASREAREKRYGDGSAKVIFSNMNEVSKQQMADYLDKLRARETAIDWSVIDPAKFETLSPGRHIGLQLADIVAGSLYCADHHCSKFKTSEWASMLRPIFHRSSQGRYRGYGIKFFPKDVESESAQGVSRMPWADSFYR